MKYAPSYIDPNHWLNGSLVPWTIRLDGTKLDPKNEDPMRRHCTWADARRGAVAIIPWPPEEIRHIDGTLDFVRVIVHGNVEIEPRPIGEFLRAIVKAAYRKYRGFVWRMIVWPGRDGESTRIPLRTRWRVAKLLAP